jgi:hypothetical protein
MAKKKPASSTTDDTKRRVSALEAQLKQLRGDTLSRQQQRDLAWFEHLERRRHIEAWQAAVPKGEYCQLASRQHKLIDDAADNYGLPLDNAEINLRDALTALHDLIAANAHRMRSAAADGDYAELKEEKLRQEIMMLEKANEKAAIELQFTRGDAIPRAQLREALVLLSAQLRTLGQTLARIQPDARDALNQFLDTLATEIESGALAF